MPKRATLLLTGMLLGAVAGPSWAQQPAIIPAPTPPAIDSTVQLRSLADTVLSTVRPEALQMGTPRADATLRTLTDTLQVTEKQEREIHKIIPREATYRSLMFPGLGQAYNRQYYKMPFIYGGYAALTYFFLRYRKLSSEAEIGYRRLLYGDYVAPAINVEVPGVPPTLGDPIFIPELYVKPDRVLIGNSFFVSSAGAKQAYDGYRRYRDLNILLSVVLYAVSAVEANVAAHLKTFDLTDDISMTIEPSALPMPGGPIPGIRMALTFK
ncbi:MAG: hypothetical protein H7319_11680 [Spirosoma sp.]|nr:hypothetical protein [Spirosoma sp.]